MGSWGKIIDYWLQQYAANTVDYVLCPLSTLPLQSGRTRAIDCTYPATEINFPLFLKWRFKKFHSALRTVFAKHRLAIILVIENTKLKNVKSTWPAQNYLHNRHNALSI